MYDIIYELSWRGLIYNITPNLQEVLKNKSITLYIGFDPTYDSLHIGNLLAIIILIHFINAGHKPIVIIGGATGIIGDPSYRNKERNNIDINSFNKNIKGIKNQIKKIVKNIEIIDNYSWIKNIKIIDFLKNIGKYITVNYMSSKDSVKNRLNKNTNYGMSFSEFSYQIFQGYDFFYLYTNKKCLLQIGGSDQWGNITTGIDLIRKKIGKIAYGLTFPLTTNSKGIKLSKSDNNDNIWLDNKYTSPYEFFQFWLNISDDDAHEYIKKYTFLSKNDIDQLLIIHKKNKSKRILQNKLAQELTTIVHGIKKCNKVLNISKFLFNKSLPKNFDIKNIKNKNFFDEMPKIEINKEDLNNKNSIIEFLKNNKLLSSKKEGYRMINEKCIMINKKYIDNNFCLSTEDIIGDRYILLQLGKKRFYIIIVI